MHKGKQSKKSSFKAMQIIEEEKDDEVSEIKGNDEDDSKFDLMGFKGMNSENILKLSKNRDLHPTRSSDTKLLNNPTAKFL